MPQGYVVVRGIKKYKGEGSFEETNLKGKTGIFTTAKSRFIRYNVPGFKGGHLKIRKEYRESVFRYKLKIYT